MPLTEQRETFCREFVACWVGAEAARRAGYSEKSAANIASMLLDDVEVARRIDELTFDARKRNNVSVDRWLQELQRIAYSDARGVMRWGGKGILLRESAELSEDEAATVAEVSETTTQSGGSMRVKMHDKMRALELIGRYLGAYRDGAMEQDGAPPEPKQIVFQVVDASEAAPCPA